MIRLPAVELPSETQIILDELQSLVNAKPTYAEQVVEGKRLFDSRRRNAIFRPVLTALTQMCSGARRCCYCEDSAATDVEHIWPKDYYPDLVFAWENYLYGCPRCNRPKSNTCAIYSSADGRRVSIPHSVRESGGPPERGEPVLINPRVEDPMEYMRLDLRDTFYFVPVGSQGTRNRERAEHTISLLKLNEEDVLPAARSEAYENYVARLEKYVYQKSQSDTQRTLAPIINSVKKMGHPTVWHEMKRQRINAQLEPLGKLFAAAPEALDW